jgi:hypothetical protein
VVTEAMPVEAAPDGSATGNARGAEGVGELTSADMLAEPDGAGGTGGGLAITRRTPSLDLATVSVTVVPTVKVGGALASISVVPICSRATPLGKRATTFASTVAPLAKRCSAPRSVETGRKLVEGAIGPIAITRVPCAATLRARAHALHGRHDAPQVGYRSVDGPVGLARSARMAQPS